MEVIRKVVSEIAVIVLMAGFLEMLLPDNSMRKYVKVVMGLFIIISLLVPMVSFLAEDETWAVNAWQFQDEGTNEVNGVISQGKDIRTNMQKVSVRECQNRLGRQIEAMVMLVPGVETVNAVVQVKMEGTEEAWTGIDTVQLRISLAQSKEEKEINDVGTIRNSVSEGNLHTSSIKSVEVPIIDSPPGPIVSSQPGSDKSKEGRSTEQVSSGGDDQEIEKRVKDTIANFYGVPREKIQINFV